MVKAYVRIDIKGGMEMTVRDTLMAIQCVKSVDLTFGEQDAIAIVEAENVEALFKIITRQIERTDGVERTMTNLVVK